MEEIEFVNDGPCEMECTGDCDGCPNGLYFATQDASFLTGAGADVEDDGWYD